MFCRDFKSQLREFGLKREKIRFTDQRLSYFTAIKCRSFLISAQKSKIISIDESSVEWIPLDDQDWIMDEKHHLIPGEKFTCNDIEKSDKVGNLWDLMKSKNQN